MFPTTHLTHKVSFRPRIKNFEIVGTAGDCYNVKSKSQKLIAANISKYGLYGDGLIYNKSTDNDEQNIYLYNLKSGAEKLYRKNYSYLGNSRDGKFVCYSSGNTKNVIEIEDTATNTIRKVSGSSDELFFISAISSDGNYLFAGSRGLNDHSGAGYKTSIFCVSNQKRKYILNEYNGFLLPINACWK